MNHKGHARREGSPPDRRSSVAGPLLVPQPFLTGRMLALAVLQESERSGRFLQDVFADFDSWHRLSPADRAMAVDVASGVVRRMRTLDVLIESRLSRSRENVEPDLWRVLQIGAQQLVFSRTPDHAAVDSTVELCRQLNRDRWTGFVNGILRSISRMLTEEFAEGPGSASLPLTAGRWRRLQSPVFPDPHRNLPEYLARAFSLPDELAARWVRRMPESELLTVCFQSVTPPATSLRVNRLQATREQVLEALTGAGVDCRPGDDPACILLDHPARLELLPGYSAGWWSVQDESAMGASILLDPRPGERILDLCAAPGGKTTHLAELSGDQAEITACDVAEGRLRRIRENAARLRLQSIRPLLIAKDGADIPSGPFDAALVDVPCSNTGVLNRRPEARWRAGEASIRELSELQTQLLEAACHRLVPGGRVVYSTCSVEPEENREVVDAVISRVPGLRVIRDRLHLPGQPADGAYQALLICETTEVTLQ